MALYLASAIEQGRLEYAAVFSIAKYTSFKPAVDAILISHGRQDLIL